MSTRKSTTRWRPSAESNRLREDAVSRWAKTPQKELLAAIRYWHRENDGHSYICELACAELNRREEKR